MSYSFPFAKVLMKKAKVIWVTVLCFHAFQVVTLTLTRLGLIRNSANLLHTFRAAVVPSRIAWFPITAARCTFALSEEKINRGSAEAGTT